MDNSLKEIKGRLTLWYFALDECRKLLDLSIKAKGAQEQCTYTKVESELIHQSSTGMAIIYFCQIVNHGNNDNDNVALNDGNFRKKHWRSLVKMSLSDSDMEKFKALVLEIKKARDQMLAHADGRAFSVEHMGPITSVNQFNLAWKDLDLLFWKASVDNILNSFGKYMTSMNIS